MKKKQGFTLIELLAVVVILAIVALISVPLIMNVIDGARKGALQNTAYGIAEAGKYAFTNEVIKDGSANFTAYSYEDGVETSSPTGKSLNYKGEKPKVGTILINSKGDIAMSIYNGKYCAEKGFDDVEVTVSEKVEADCVLVEELTEVEVLVVAGGGSGGTNHACGTITGAGGGGAGGLIYNAAYSVIPGEIIDITVGAGGVSPATCGPGGNGGSSSFGTIETIGGGGGGYRTGLPLAGGSGGGTGFFSAVGGLGTPSQGFDGGSSVGSVYGGSGGGGASEVGGFSTGNIGTVGGNGLQFSISGTSTWYAGGGGGGSHEADPGGNGGSGGGGNGGSNSNGTSALLNTGGGGGGSGDEGYIGGNGGSGVVVVRYFGPQRADGGAVTIAGDYTVHTFTSGTATFTPSDL